MSLNEDMNKVAITFEKYGLNVMQISRYSKGEPTSAILGLADFNGETFAFDIRGRVAYMAFVPLYLKKSFVPYPEELPTPTKLEIYYKASDLTPNLLNALSEVTGRKIFSKEVEDFDINHFRITSSKSSPQEEDDAPFINLEYRLQKPSDQHSKCIAAIDIKDFNPRLFPYHTQQANHYCMTNVEEFPLIPFDLNGNEGGIVLDINYWGVWIKKELKSFLLDYHYQSTQEHCLRIMMQSTMTQFCHFKSMVLKLNLMARVADLNSNLLVEI